MGKSKGGNIYLKGVTVRFGFDVLRTWKIQKTSQKQSNGDALWDAYTWHPEHFLWLYVMGSRSGMLVIYIIVGLSALLVSTSRAIPGPLEREASDRLAPRFLYMYVLS